MTAASDWLENDTLTRHLVTNPCFVALYTVATTDAGGGTEVTGGSYARRQGTFTVTNGVATLSADLVWNGMPGATVVGLAILSALTGGNLLFHGLLTAPKTIAAGDAFALPTGNLTVTMD